MSPRDKAVVALDKAETTFEAAAGKNSSKTADGLAVIALLEDIDVGNLPTNILEKALSRMDKTFERILEALKAKQERAALDGVLEAWKKCVRRCERHIKNLKVEDRILAKWKKLIAFLNGVVRKIKAVKAAQEKAKRARRRKESEKARKLEERLAKQKREAEKAKQKRKEAARAQTQQQEERERKGQRTLLHKPGTSDDFSVFLEGWTARNKKISKTARAGNLRSRAALKGTRRKHGGKRNGKRKDGH